MIIIDRNERFFAGGNGEKITVVVKSQNTAHGVTYSLDGKAAVMNQTGPETSTLIFPLNQAANDPSQLLLMFHFLNTGGGAIYRVLITGSQGGQPFGQIVRQLGPTDKTASTGYTFDVI